LSAALCCICDLGKAVFAMQIMLATAKAYNLACTTTNELSAHDVCVVARVCGTQFLMQALAMQFSFSSIEFGV